MLAGRKVEKLDPKKEAGKAGVSVVDMAGKGNPKVKKLKEGRPPPLQPQVNPHLSRIPERSSPEEALSCQVQS